MRLTKLGHSCVRLDKDGASLVIDPGMWSGADALAGADAVLITHEHADHIDGDVVRTALESNPALELWTVPVVAAEYVGFGGRVHGVGHGDAFTTVGFDVHVHGHHHAPIYPDMPAVPNVGFGIDGNVFHPGDSFTVPEDPVPVLLLPVSAPWLKISEAIGYAREVAPARGGYAIHDAILSEQGIGLVSNILKLMARPGDAAFTRLAPGTSVGL